jgi:hypothetical protein
VFRATARSAKKAALATAIVTFVASGCGVAVSTSPSPTPAASAAPSPAATPRPTSTGDAGLPVGPFNVEDAGVSMTVTIPASGWTFVPQVSGLIKGVEVANVPEAAIHLWGTPPGTEFYVPGNPCRVTSTRPDTPATTVDDLAAALAAQVDRYASLPEDVTIGGYAGKWVTLHVPEDATFAACEMGKFVSFGVGEDPLGRWQQGPGQIDEFWLVDVNGAIAVLNAMYRPDTSPSLVEETRGIVESTTFGTP